MYFLLDEASGRSSELCETAGIFGQIFHVDGLISLVGEIWKKETKENVQPAGLHSLQASPN